MMFWGVSPNRNSEVSNGELRTRQNRVILISRRIVSSSSLQDEGGGIRRHESRLLRIIEPSVGGAITKDTFGFPKKTVNDFACGFREGRPLLVNAPGNHVVCG